MLLDIEIEDTIFKRCYCSLWSKRRNYVNLDLSPIQVVFSILIGQLINVHFLGNKVA